MHPTACGIHPGWVRTHLDVELDFVRRSAAAARIGGELVDALDHAYAHRVVHRDIQPENVLLQGGHAELTDFGIARALAPGEAAKLTGAGMTVGTPPYREHTPSEGPELHFAA